MWLLGFLVLVARASVRVVAVELQPQQVLQPVQVQVRLLARAQAEGVAMTLHEARDMIHVWPLLPIAQARPAIRTMAELIRVPA